MDRFAELRAFTAVIEAGGFSAAARRTGQSRSAVNRLVMALETRLGVQLLHRTTRSVGANSAGRALYDRARQLLEDLDEIERATGSARTEAVGRLRISTPLSFGDLDFSAIVTDFQLAHPGIETHVAFENRFVDPVAEGYDAVIRVAEPDETTTLVDHRIRRLDYLLAAAPAYLAAHGTPGRARELADHATLYLRRDAGAAAWALEGPGGPESVALRPVLQANNFETLLTAARSGLGIAMMPEYAVRSEIEGGRLVQVLADLALPARMLQVIYPPSRHLSARLRLFVDFVEARCGG